MNIVAERWTRFHLISVNTRGLPALPNEIYLEILNHMPALPIPHDDWVDKKMDPLRQLTLYYLTQACQSLREFFLKFAWERIEVFGGMWSPMGMLSTTAVGASKRFFGSSRQLLWGILTCGNMCRERLNKPLLCPRFNFCLSIVVSLILRSRNTLLPEISLSSLIYIPFSSYFNFVITVNSRPFSQRFAIPTYKLWTWTVWLLIGISSRHAQTQGISPFTSRMRSTFIN